MSLKRYAARRDKTEPEIFRALRQVGADVLSLDKFDALILFRGQLYMIDAKVAKGKATKRQADLVKRGWPLRFVRTPEEALKCIGAIK